MYFANCVGRGPGGWHRWPVAVLPSPPDLARCRAGRSWQQSRDRLRQQDMTSQAVQPSLPAEPNVFIGRERELAELRKLLRGTRALTLCGAGGIGKTRLALRLINGLATQFPEGVWLVELGDLRQPDLVVPRIAATVGVAEEPG